MSLILIFYRPLLRTRKKLKQVSDYVSSQLNIRLNLTADEKQLKQLRDYISSQLNISLILTADEYYSILVNLEKCFIELFPVMGFNRVGIFSFENV